MNLEKVIFGFFIVLAATLNFGFFIGDIDNPAHHDIYELFAAIVVSLIATVLKFGDRTQIGAVHLSTSLVADLQLIAAAMAHARERGQDRFYLTAQSDKLGFYESLGFVAFGPEFMDGGMPHRAMRDYDKQSAVLVD